MSKKKISAKEVFVSYLMSHHREELRYVLEQKDEQIHYALEVDFLNLSEEHVEVAESILASPMKMLALFDTAFVKALLKFQEEDLYSESLTLKYKVHIRLIGLPRYPEIFRHTVPHTTDVGRILCISGTVVRTMSPKMLEYQREYICLKCKHGFTIKADYTLHYQISKPPRCPNPNTCYSTTFILNDSAKKFSYTKDYQEIKIQEQAQKLSVGTIPRSIWVTLEDDLVDSAKPGDDVIICGIVLQRWLGMSKGSCPTIDLVVKANNLKVNNKQRSGTILTNEMKAEFKSFWEAFKFDPLEGRNLILSSFCPQVYGLYLVKLAVATIIAGGVQKIDANGTRTRGESHLLLVGDPGTGKSQFLKYVSHLVPRCVLTTGIGTTSAGLTVSAVREEGEWALEAGALVLSDGGVCCIDEFNSIREADRAAIHEAMEQQTISVAKAGIVCKLNSRCSILAATNPKGRYDVNESLNVNVALASPLLSRFDLILVLLDSRNEEWDKFVSSYILQGRDLLSDGAKDNGSLFWTMERLQSYFCHIRSLQPKMTHEAHLILTKYYQLQRQTDGRSQARTTIRLLESLVRLSQGHARLLMKEEVNTMDAIVAVTLVEVSMCGTALFKEGNALHTAFPPSPRDEYRNQVSVILQKLGLLDLLTKEVDLLNKREKQLFECEARNEFDFNIMNRVTIESSTIPRSRLFGRGIVPTQSNQSFSNILEMNESSDEENSPVVGREKKKKRSRKTNKGMSSKRSKIERDNKDHNDSACVSRDSLMSGEKFSSLQSGDRVSKDESCSPESSPKFPKKCLNVKNYKNKRKNNSTPRKTKSNSPSPEEVSSFNAHSPSFDFDFEDNTLFANRRKKATDEKPDRKSNSQTKQNSPIEVIAGESKISSGRFGGEGDCQKLPDSRNRMKNLLEQFSFKKGNVPILKHSEKEESSIGDKKKLNSDKSSLNCFPILTNSSNMTTKHVEEKGHNNVNENKGTKIVDKKSLSNSPILKRCPSKSPFKPIPENSSAAILEKNVGESKFNFPSQSPVVSEIPPKLSFSEKLLNYKYNSGRLKNNEGSKDTFVNAEEESKSLESIPPFKSCSTSQESSIANGKSIEVTRDCSQLFQYKSSLESSSCSSQGIRNGVDKSKVISIFDHMDEDIDFDF